MNLVFRVRRKVAKMVSRKLLPSTFSIISDDCWGGQLYRQLQIQYATPTVGLFVNSGDFLRYLEDFEAIHRHRFEFVEVGQDYPVGSLAGVEIHFMHYATEEEAETAYWKRFARIRRETLRVKIDFGKPEYTREHVRKWNEMALENSLALYPPSLEVPEGGIHNGVQVDDWTIDGARLFDASRRYFNLFRWVRSGRVVNGVGYRCANQLLLDPRVGK